MIEGSVVALVGGQYGSEGKGAIAAHLARQFDTHVRVGGPNAGHTYRDPSGRMFVSQQLPCGWINPSAALVIGRGAVVDVEQLDKEIRLAEEVDPTVRQRVFLDRHAWPLTVFDQINEGGVDGDMHRLIGSTGKGVGAARIERIDRDPRSPRSIVTELERHGISIPVVDTVDLLHSGGAGRILLEGTQGSGLSLIHGPWPYVTSEDTNAAGLLAATGVPPQALEKTILVVRTYPIRVAGNSGPLPKETSWEYLSAATNGYIRPERTTVTKKVRRVAHFDIEVVRQAVRLNGRCEIAATFLDYLDPKLAGETNREVIWASEAAEAFVEYLSEQAAPVVMGGTGPASVAWL